MYQEPHNEIIDYELYQLPTGHHIRGPEPESLSPGEYFTCVGAAQTFGCFCEKPYPALLSDELGLSPLNLGFAGAGPRFFLNHQSLLRYINRGRFAIVQVMSARSEDSSCFDSRGLEYLTRRSDGARLGAEPAYRTLMETESQERVEEVVAETRANWVESYRRLLGLIKVPTILLWFSTRSPDYQENYVDVWGVFGKFPQMVNRSMVEQIKPLCDEYVECISSRGLPQPLVSRFTGEAVSIVHREDLGTKWDAFNPYYPSPEMHADAFDALVESCRRVGSETRVT
jgi:hypothetical protein